MRLTCDICVATRSSNSGSSRMQGKPVRASVSVGRKNGRGDDGRSSTVFLLVCTAKERSGTKYKVHGNILQVFNKFVQDGKATIRLNEPPHDLFISKADPSSLKSLLSLLKLSARDLDKAALTTLAPAKLVDLERPKKDLVVTRRVDYPLAKPFPEQIQNLVISNCYMKKFDRRILLLKELTSLSLSDNIFQEIPLGITNMAKLSELSLVNNNIKEIHWKLFSGPLAVSLRFLDLRNNNLEYLPSTFCGFRNLVHLKLDGNRLVLLPRRIGSLVNLRFLTASANKLKVLPISLKKLRLESLDLSNNPFLEDKEYHPMNCQGFPSLMELAGQVARKFMCSYHPRIIPSSLCHYLDSAKQCHCGNYCFKSCIHSIIKINIQEISHTVVSAGGTQNLLPAEIFLCSQRCLVSSQLAPHLFS